MVDPRSVTGTAAAARPAEAVSAPWFVGLLPRPGTRPVPDVLDYMVAAAGRSNAEIAAALHLSVATVKTHVSRLLAKLDCRDRAQLVVVAYQSGAVSPA